MWYNIVKLLVLCEKKLIEWGLWNNSWVKNLPVRPLAPRRKTPGQLYPTFRPPGQGQKFAIFIIYDILYNYKGNQLSTHKKQPIIIFIRDGEMVKSEACLDAQA